MQRLLLKRFMRKGAAARTYDSNIDGGAANSTYTISIDGGSASATGTLITGGFAV